MSGKKSKLTMAKGDIKVLKHPGPTVKYRVDDRTSSSASATMKAGEPIKRTSASGGNFALLCATGDPLIGSTNQPFLGITRKESTETSTVDGVVECISIV